MQPAHVSIVAHNVVAAAAASSGAAFVGGGHWRRTLRFVRFAFALLR